jgi:hypothetical protein
VIANVMAHSCRWSSARFLSNCLRLLMVVDGVEFVVVFVFKKRD